MCYEADAVPPIYGPPRTFVRSRQVELVSADGSTFAGYEVMPFERHGPAVLVLPDNRGLFGFYEHLADRFAEQGHPALAIDYFGRTDGTAYRDRGADFALPERHMPRLGQLTKDGLYADFATGIGHLRAVAGGPVVSFGCCLGGRFAYLTASARFGLAGAIGLYGYPDPIREAPGPTQLAGELTAPILAVFGGADAGIPPETVARFASALTEAGVPHEFVSYPGAPHGFFEAGEGRFDADCADVWRRSLTFLDAHSG